MTCPSTWPAPTIPVLLVLGWCLVTCPSTWPAPAASPNLPWRSSSGTHFPSHAYHQLLIRLTLLAVSFFQSWIEPPECYFSLSSIIRSVVLNLMHTYPMNPSIKTSRHVRVGETVLPNKFLKKFSSIGTGTGLYCMPHFSPPRIFTVIVAVSSTLEWSPIQVPAGLLLL